VNCRAIVPVEWSHWKWFDTHGSSLSASRPTRGGGSPSRKKVARDAGLSEAKGANQNINAGARPKVIPGISRGKRSPPMHRRRRAVFIRDEQAAIFATNRLRCRMIVPRTGLTSTIRSGGRNHQLP
jgi:hypothetical protein